MARTAEQRAAKMASRALSAFEQAATDLHEAAHIQRVEADVRRANAGALQERVYDLTDEARALETLAADNRRRAEKLSSFLA